MKLRTIYGFLCLTLLFPIGAFAAHWQTHLAYNNVTQIAMAEDEVFAISDGSLFSIDKQTEKLRTTACPVYTAQASPVSTTIR